MTLNRRKATGRGSGPSFVLLTHQMLMSENFRKLTPKAVKLLINIASQYKGKNNGDLAMTWEQMRGFGWTSKQTLYRARNELLKYGFLLVSRQGGKNRCSLYAITWQAVDECYGKLDIKPTAAAPGNWKLCPEN